MNTSARAVDYPRKDNNCYGRTSQGGEYGGISELPETVYTRSWSHWPKCGYKYFIKVFQREVDGN